MADLVPLDNVYMASWSSIIVSRVHVDGSQRARSGESIHNRWEGRMCPTDHVLELGRGPGGPFGDGFVCLRTKTSQRSTERGTVTWRSA